MELLASGGISFGDNPEPPAKNTIRLGRSLALQEERGGGLKIRPSVSIV